MKYTPIIFSTDMIPRVLDGSKTQTRRTYGLQRVNAQPDNFWLHAESNKNGNGLWIFDQPSGELVVVKCPYGQAGDRLWCKEVWAVDRLWDDRKPSDICCRVAVWYIADSRGAWVGKTRSPLFMPRWASRITLENTVDPYPQRLQEITAYDAVDEGFPYSKYDGETHTAHLLKPRLGFQTYWDSLNAKRGYPWENNDWVWVVSFRKMEHSGDL